MSSIAPKNISDPLYYFQPKMQVASHRKQENIVKLPIIDETEENSLLPPKQEECGGPLVRSPACFFPINKKA